MSDSCRKLNRNTPITHGGDLAAVQRRFPHAPRPWLDLSTGINPHAYPIGDIGADVWSRLPGSEQHQALVAAARRRYGVSGGIDVIAAPGTQALIQLLPRLIPSATVAIVGPTYEEHAAAWRRQGHDVRVVPYISEIGAADVVVVVNPDNPSGRLLAPKDFCASHRLLVVDEAFIDFLPSTASLAGNLPPRTIVLRSFGKTYGLAGLRLGFAIAAPELSVALHDELGPWAVSGPALRIGHTALSDDAWLDAMRERLAVDGRQLDGLLATAGFTPLGVTPLFRLVAHERADDVVTQLCLAGIHVRAFPNQPRWLRFGLPGRDEDFMRLTKALGI